MTNRVSIQSEDFDLSQELQTLRLDDRRVGAVCSFIGTVRELNVGPTLATSSAALDRPMPEATSLGPVQTDAGRSGAGGFSPEGALSPRGSPSATDAALSLELEHYPGMTEKAIEAMIDQAMARFDIFGARVVHRVGVLQPLDQIVLVAVTAAHRGESFKACEFLMDYLKTQAPFWKKEQTRNGARWVDARVSDDQALARWGIKADNA
ncbi:MAG: molybdenum cofactor biosynthesis protein MoaE [Betaproteobacteria bacterium]